MTIKAILKADGDFISLAFEVRGPGSASQAPDKPADASPRQSFGPLRLATVDDAVMLLAQFARYLDPPRQGSS